MTKQFGLRPDYAEAYNNRGCAYRAKGDYDKAIEDYTKALSLKADYVVALQNRAMAYEDKSDYGRALQDLIQANQLVPRSATITMARGIALFYSGQVSAARAAFQSAIELEPRNYFSHLWIYLAQDVSREQARRELETRVADVKLSEWPGQLVDFYLGRVSHEEISSAFHNYNPNTQLVRLCAASFFLGEFALQNGDKTEAIARFRDAVATQMKDSLAYSSAQAELSRLATQNMPIKRAARSTR